MTTDVNRPSAAQARARLVAEAREAAAALRHRAQQVGSDELLFDTPKAVADARQLADLLDALVDTDPVEREGSAAALVERIRGTVSNAPACDEYADDDVITCGWKSDMKRVRRALDEHPDGMEPERLLVEVEVVREWEDGDWESGQKGYWYAVGGEVSIVRSTLEPHTAADFLHSLTYADGFPEGFESALAEQLRAVVPESLHT